MKQMLLFTAATLIATACNQPGPDAATAEKARQIAGQYKGTTPCADCEGIDYTVTLNPDFTYATSAVYVGKDPSPKTASGKFTIVGNQVRLAEKSSGMDWFDIGENKLTLLDLNGKTIEGSLASRYILYKEGFQPQTEGAGNPAFANKRNAGVEFIAMGTEPFWGLDMDLDKQFLFHGADIDSVSLPATAPRNVKPDGTVEYQAAFEGKKMTVTITPAPCSDGMSDTQYAYTVAVTLNDKTYKGCGVMLGGSINSVWRLKTVNGAAPAKDAFMKTPYFAVQEEGNAYAGSDGCNQIGGQLKHTAPNKIQFMPGRSTMMACPGNGPDAYTKLLFSVDGYNLKGNELELTAAGKTVLTYGL